MRRIAFLPALVIVFLLAFAAAGLAGKPDFKQQAKSLQDRGRYRDAVVQWNNYLAGHGSSHYGYSMRGECYRKLGEYRRAIEDFERAIQLESDYDWAYAHLAESRLALKQYDAAIAGFTRAVELDPDYHWAYAHRGRAYRKKGDYARAVADFTRAIELNSEYEWAYAQRGFALAKQDSHDRAIEDFAEAIRLDPDDSWNYAHRAESYRKQGRYEEAIRDFTRAVDLKPGYDWAFAHRGESRRRAGDGAGAIEDFERALQLNPEYSWAESKLKLAREAAGRSEFGLFVETRPADASVKIMNIKPAFHQGIRLSPGRYVLRIERAGYETLEEVVYIEESDLRLFYALSPPEPPSRKRRLFVETRPSDADVKIFGVGSGFRRGMKLEPGRYSLRIEKEGFEPIEDSVEIGDSDLRLFYALQKRRAAALERNDSNAETERAEGPPVAPGARREHWAVVIGVSRYADSRIPTLRYADVDAKAFHDWLVSPQGGRYAPSRVKLLLNEQATSRNIRDALFRWLRGAIEEDVVIIYFAGHGSPESPDHPDNLFLLSHDAAYDSIASTGFPMWDIKTALKRFVRAKRVVVIADACHSAGVGQAFDVSRRSSSRNIGVNRINTALENLSNVGDGVAVLTAAGSDQTSQEGPQWGGGHGVFTHFLLEGLDGGADYNGDRAVTLGELIPYLSQQVRRETRNAQAPVIAGRFDPALGIGR